MQNDSSDLLFCPSFNCYSDDKKLVDIAATVRRESPGVLDDEDFEFSNNLLESPEPSSFPIFNRDLLLNGEEQECGDDDDDDEGKEAVRIPLRNLFIGDGDLPSSSSSSDVDELEGLPAETYCVWKPKQSPGSSPNRCNKSKSTGSSSSKRRWNLIKDLLKRSNSDSKVSASSSLFLNFDKSTIEKKLEEKASKKKATTATTTMKKKSEGELMATKSKRVEKASAHEVFYMRNKALKEGVKRRSYLPYRQDLVGIFANVNGIGRTFPTF